MHADFESSLVKLSKMSSEESTSFFADLSNDSRNDLVNAQWTVKYDPIGHDMHSLARVSLVNEGDALLQIFLTNTASGTWIPEIMPWELSGVEFKAEQGITSAALGLIDSKWTDDDSGREYYYRLFGHLLHNDKRESFAFEKSAVFPSGAP